MLNQHYGLEQVNRRLIDQIATCIAIIKVQNRCFQDDPKEYQKDISKFAIIKQMSQYTIDLTKD